LLAPKNRACKSNQHFTRISTDPKAIRTEYAYNAFNERTQLTEAAGTVDEAVTRYAYDGNGNLTSITNAKGAVE
jgi:YD repeat-containing protein